MRRRLGLLFVLSVVGARAAIACNGDEDAAPTPTEAGVDGSLPDTGGGVGPDTSVVYDGGPCVFGDNPPNVVQQKCPPDEPRCTILINGNVRSTGCTAAKGSGALGAGCTVKSPETGDDSCQTGLFCTSIGYAPGDKHCRKLCLGSGECAATESCYKISLGSQSAPFGFCVERCTPFTAGGCPAGGSCKALPATTSNGGPTFTLFCIPPGAAAEGASCKSSAACAEALDCVGFDAGPACRVACDDTHGCDASTTDATACESIKPLTGAPSGYGACH